MRLDWSQYDIQIRYKATANTIKSTILARHAKDKMNAAAMAERLDNPEVHAYTVQRYKRWLQLKH